MQVVVAERTELRRLFALNAEATRPTQLAVRATELVLEAAGWAVEACVTVAVVTASEGTTATWCLHTVVARVTCIALEASLGVVHVRAVEILPRLARRGCRLETAFRTVSIARAVMARSLACKALVRAHWAQFVSGRVGGAL